MMEKSKKPLRIVIGILAMVWIAVMWAKKDLTAVYASMPKEQLIPFFLTTVAVTLIKVGAISGVVFLCKYLIGKYFIKRK